MRRSLVALAILFLLVAVPLASAEKFTDAPGELKAKGNDLLAELISFEYDFHGPNYVTFYIQTGAV
ncbi:MAG: hypothetical protein WC712_08085, partial [Candidatus Brocadiia bacterium]